MEEQEPFSRPLSMFCTLEEHRDDGVIPHWEIRYILFRSYLLLNILSLRYVSCVVTAFNAWLLINSVDFTRMVSSPLQGIYCTNSTHYVIPLE
jgi:hypothetical protein